MKTLMERFFKDLFIMATAYEINLDFAYKMRKNTNGPGFKTNPMATMIFLLKSFDQP
jgi:hypothetical protein